MLYYINMLVSDYNYNLPNFDDADLNVVSDKISFSAMVFSALYTSGRMRNSLSFISNSFLISSNAANVGSYIEWQSVIRATSLPVYSAVSLLMMVTSSIYPFSTYF